MRFTVLLSFLLCSLVSSAAPWNYDLWLGRGRVWESRFNISVKNPSDAIYEGKTISIVIGSAPGEAPLAGTEAASLRVVNAENKQLLFNIWQPDLSDVINKGPIPKDSLLTIPLVCGAKSSAAFTVYFNNSSAWGLADFLQDRPESPLNGDFELGKTSPLGWFENRTEPMHKLTLSAESPYSGKHCIKQVAAPGLKPSWAGYYRDGLIVTPGADYAIKIRVRTKDLKGTAGWYVHVGNTKNSQMLNRNASTDNPDTDWTELAIKFKAPEEATHMRTGSFLRGSGTAWFDDLRIESDKPFNTKPQLKISCSAIENLKLKREGEDAEWIDPPEGIDRWNFRFPLSIVPTPGTEPGKSMLAVIELDSVTRGLPDPSFKLTLNGREIETYRLAENLLFKVTSKPDTLQTLYLYVADAGGKGSEAEAFNSALGSDIPSDQIAVAPGDKVDMESWKMLLNSDLNLVKNPDFEEGEPTPSEWESSGVAPDNKEITQTKAAKGLFGKFCAETSVSESAEPNWYGWRQNIAVTPGSTYLFGGWMSTEEFKASGQIYAHINPRKGSKAKTVFLSAGRKISGTTGWTPMFSSVTIPYDHDMFSLQLTSNTSGTMRHDGFFMAPCLPAMIGQPQTLPQKEELIIWQANPIVKIFKESLPNARKDVGIHMALNESEPLQLAVRSGRDFEKLHIKVSPPVLKSGGFLRNLFKFGDGTTDKSRSVLSNITIGRVDYVPIDAKSCYSSYRTPEWEFKYPRQKNGSDGWAGWWPDPIVETQDFSLKANRTQPLWITFDTNAQTKPGEYRGTIAIIDNGKTLLKQSYSVNVWDFEIPLRPDFSAIYDIRFRNINFSNWKDRDKAREKILRFMAKKKLSPDSVLSGIPLKLDKSGNVICDFTEYDKACRLYFDELQFKVSYMPHNFYIFGWAYPPRKFLGEQPYEGEYPFEKADRSKLRPEYKKVYQQALKLYWEHIKKMGWAKHFVLYISDEPHFSHEHIAVQMQALCTMIHEVDPAIRIYSSTWRHCPEWDNSIDVWGVGHYGCFPVDEMHRQKMIGNEIWFTTDGQMCTDTPLLATERMLPHYAFKYDADAYEFWGVSWYTHNPWKFGWHSYIRQSSTPGEYYSVRYPDGDGYLIYPPVPEMGNSQEPITSIRIEAARDGVEDWCYLQKLKTLAIQKKDTEALALLDEFLSFCEIPNAGGRYTGRNLSGPDRLMQLRIEMGATIERLSR